MSAGNRGFQDCLIKVKFPANQFVKTIDTHYWEENLEQAPTVRVHSTRVKSNVSEAEVTVADLKPNTNHSMIFYLVTDYGKGFASDVKTAHNKHPILTNCTTLPSSMPSNLQTEEISSETAKFSWREPIIVASGVDITQYVYRLKNLDLENAHWEGIPTTRRIPKATKIRNYK